MIGSMATEFLRLYKELCKNDREMIDTGMPRKHNEVQESAMYPSMRLSVLSELGYDTFQNIPAPVQPSRYHGKMARRLAKLKNTGDGDEGSSKAKNREPNAMREQALKRKLLAGIVAETTRISKVTAEIEKFSVLGQPISDDLVFKLANETKRRTVAARVATLPPPKPVFTKREPFKLKSGSKNKWSNEEREKLNSLFIENPPPSTSQLTAWSLYYKNMAQLFCGIFRKRTEVCMLHVTLLRFFMAS